MALTEQAQAFLEAMTALGAPPLEQMTVAEARSRKMPSLGEMEPVAEQYDVALPVRHGSIRARVYVPLEAVALSQDTSAATSQPVKTRLPAVVYIHGGGWVLGELDHYDLLCCSLTNRSGCLVISLEYRLAPEYPFPLGLEDCLDAVAVLSQQPWTANRSADQNWELDPNRMFLMGDSAGANLCSVVIQEFLDHEQVNLQGQVLVYPVTDSRLTRPSYRRNGEGYLLTTASMQWFWDHYCPDENSRRLPTAAPIQFPQLERMPATYIITCEYDPLLDEGNAYARKLQGAGVEVQHAEIPGMIHAFMRFQRTFPEARQQLTQIAEWLQVHSRSDLPLQGE